MAVMGEETEAAVMGGETEAAVTVEVMAAVVMGEETEAAVMEVAKEAAKAVIGYGADHSHHNQFPMHT